MDLYQSALTSQLDSIKSQGHYRVFIELERLLGQFPYALHKGKKTIMWCSNDYLGMSQNNEVISAMKEALEKSGAGSGGTRNISGTQNYHRMLEQELADVHGKEAALLLSSGYVANEAALMTLAGKLPNCVVFSDAENHASLIHGIRESRAEKHIFEHNNVTHLESLLKSAPIDRPKIIVFESVYSMSGSIAPIVEICQLAKRYQALTYLDEVHAVGLYGHMGGGIAQELGVQDQVDIICGNFGKAYGVMGGFITASSTIVDFVRSFAGPFIFTTSLSPVIVAGALASVRYLKYSQKEREALQNKVVKVKSALRAANIPFLESPSQMVPVMIRNADLCRQVSNTLLNDYGIYVQPVNYPTVPKGTERLRVTPTPYHTDEMIEHLVISLKETLSLLS
ncbi:MAG: 5-aminolevulinic acid synthase [Gammaproteobacteria bacterium]|jgi:5-aminolevulinate synthase|nr:5-aminolevulinic acid synthase [Gammaproteobacteria bacterium]